MFTGLENGTWSSLPDGSFSSQGTNVRTALLVLEAPALERTAAA